MKKRAILMAAALGMMAVVSGCSGQAAGNTAAETAGTTAKEAETTAAEAAADTDTDTKAPETEASEAGAAGGTFTVGFDQEFPPMGYVGDDGEYTGFDLEVAEEAVSYTHLHLCSRKEENNYEIDSKETRTYRHRSINYGIYLCMWQRHNC